MTPVDRLMRTLLYEGFCCTLIGQTRSKTGNGLRLELCVRSDLLRENHRERMQVRCRPNASSSRRTTPYLRAGAIPALAVPRRRRRGNGPDDSSPFGVLRA